MGGQRVCSLLPSATEIVYALGLGERLVGVTHECDFPPEARHKAHVTSSVITSDSLSSAAIDQAVRDSLADQATIYHLNRDLLEELQPDLILTQDLCDVCAVGTDLVQDAVASLPFSPMVVSLEPRTLDEVIASIGTVGRLMETEDVASALAQTLRARIEAVQQVVASQRRIRVLTLEWLDPVFVGGPWVPEMVHLAGGEDVLGRAGEPSWQASWEQVAASDPEIVIAMPCGFDLERTFQELERTPLPAEWHTLPAVQQGRVFAVDGSSYFNRPGPRLIDGVEILASILHPELFSVVPPESYVKYRASTESTSAMTTQ